MSGGSRSTATRCSAVPRRASTQRTSHAACGAGDHGHRHGVPPVPKRTRRALPVGLASGRLWPQGVPGARTRRILPMHAAADPGRRNGGTPVAGADAHRGGRGAFRQARRPTGRFLRVMSDTSEGLVVTHGGVDLRARLRHPVWIFYGVAALLLVAFGVSLVVRPVGQTWSFVDNWLVDAFEVAVALACLAGAVRKSTGRRLGAGARPRVAVLGRRRRHLDVEPDVLGLPGRRPLPRHVPTGLRGPPDPGALLHRTVPGQRLARRRHRRTRGGGRRVPPSPSTPS